MLRGFRKTMCGLIADGWDRPIIDHPYAFMAQIRVPLDSATSDVWGWCHERVVFSGGAGKRRTVGEPGRAGPDRADTARPCVARSTRLAPARVRRALHGNWAESVADYNPYTALLEG